MAFEESMKKLEEISSKIRNENTSLDDALKCYEDGMKEYKVLVDILDEAKQKIEVYDNKEK